MRDIRAVLFDLDDTLHDDTLAFTSAAEEVAREVAAEHGIDALELKAAYVAEAEGFWHRLDRDQVRERISHLREAFWASALERVGLTDPMLAQTSAANYHAYRNKYFALFPGALDLLRDLKSRGVKLGMVTNGFSETHRDKLIVLQISELFDALFLPDETGMVKPDPLLFAHACRELGVAPKHSAMVGDRYERDIAGAQQAGLMTVWVNVRGEPVPDGGKPPDANVERIDQVAAVLFP
ncbi:MAG TPA: HAD family hydrolase [Candidatus Baltobacteraceae bacterium]|nr:HAD family hydrolase [Candidatus Baltobacteraceae bacterium]